MLAGATSTLQKLRALCLGYPETSEASAWGHPNFKAGKRVFVTFEQWQGRPSIAFRLSAAEVERRLGRPSFFETPYGRGQWISVWADGTLDWAAISALVDRSYRVVALKRMIAALDARRPRGG